MSHPLGQQCLGAAGHSCHRTKLGLSEGGWIFLFPGGKRHLSNLAALLGAGGRGREEESTSLKTKIHLILNKWEK